MSSSGSSARTQPWFAHVSYWRPHPPYAAAGHWAQAYSPDDVDLPIAPVAVRHPLHDAALGLVGGGCAA